MRGVLILSALLIIFSNFSCKKEDKKEYFPNKDCNTDGQTIRQIINKKATVKLTATYFEAVYLVEENAIDTRLIPCNFPMEFYQDGLVVIISGDVKVTKQRDGVPCCAENFVITKIRKE